MIAKSNFLEIKDIFERLKTNLYTKKQKTFGRMALKIYSQYQKYLDDNEKIDFNDMINKAVELVNKNPEKYLNFYDHILIDEFQDISYQRLELIRAFVNENSKTKLFCVGDDWQSIYQFTGSDVRFFTEFENYFSNPQITHLEKNYRCSQNIVNLSNKLISKNKKQIKKTVISTNEIGQKPLVFEFPSNFSKSYTKQVPECYNLIKILLDEGISPGDIMVISRFNNLVKEIEIKCGAEGIPTERKAGGTRFFSVHKSKGTESDHVILMDVTSGLYGFPCEIQDPSVIELAQRFKEKNRFEEERRLFYVALTRSRKFLYIYTIAGNKSMFLDEIEPYHKKIFVEPDIMWDAILPELISNNLKGIKSEIPIICPECGKRLIEREGAHGKFIGCTGYPSCNYTFDLEIKTENKRYGICPKCGKRLVERSGKYGKFYGCLGYPTCKYTYDPKKERKNTFTPFRRYKPYRKKRR